MSMGNRARASWPGRLGLLIGLIALFGAAEGRAVLPPLAIISGAGPALTPVRDEQPIRIPSSLAAPSVTNIYPAYELFLHRNLMSTYQEFGPQDPVTTRFLDQAIYFISRGSAATMSVAFIETAVAITNANPAVQAASARILRADPRQQHEVARRFQMAGERSIAPPRQPYTEMLCAQGLTLYTLKARPQYTNDAHRFRQRWADALLATARSGGYSSADRWVFAQDLDLLASPTRCDWPGLNAFMIEGLNSATNMDPWMRAYGLGIFRGSCGAGPQVCLEHQGFTSMKGPEIRP